MTGDTVPPGASPAPLHLLLLCDLQWGMAATVNAHVEALIRHSRHRIRPLCMLGDLPAGLELGRFDGVIIHYSLVACREDHLSRAARQKLAGFAGLKAIFLQDEYRHVAATIAAIREIGVTLIFTCVPTAEIEKVYPAGALPGVTTATVLTGYVPAELTRRAVPDFADRPIEVGYRARELPPWVGELGQEKWRIGHRFLADAQRYRLRCDISWREEDRLYGAQWLRFLCRCRAVLGVESGASVFDFTGEIQDRVESHLRRAPMTDFAELQQLYFCEAEGRIRLNQISPRCFEAAALRTLMILYEGEYSGILQPGRHYVPLTKDHSNIGEVVAVLRDPAHAQEIIDTAYREVALNPLYGFPRLAAILDQHIADCFQATMAKALPPYQDSHYRRAARLPLRDRWRRFGRASFYVIYRGVFGYGLGFLPARQRDVIKRLVKGVLSRPSTTALPVGYATAPRFRSARTR